MGQGAEFIAPAMTKSVKNAKSSVDMLKKLANKEEREKLQALSDEEKAKLFEGEFKKLKDNEKGKMEAMSMVLPGGASGKAAIGMGALAGAESGLSKMEKNEDVGKLVSDTLMGAGGGAVAKGAEKVLKSAGKFAYNTVFDEGKKGAENAVKAGTKTLGEIAMEKGEVGGTKSLFEKSSKRIVDAEKQLQEALSSSDGTIDMNDVYKAVEPQIKKFQESGNKTAANNIMQRLMDITEENGMNVPASKANEIKRSLYLESDKAFGTEKATAIEGIKDIARGLKEGIEKVAPEVKDINKILSYNGRIKDAMLPQMGKEARGKWLNALNVLTIAGGAIGAPISGGASLAAPAATLLATNPLVQTLTGQAANKAGEVVGGNAAQKVAQQMGIKTGDAVSGLFSNNGGQEQNSANADGTNANPIELNAEQQKNNSNKENKAEAQGSTHNLNTIPQDKPIATPNPDELVTITNDATGETKQVKRSQLGEFGIQPEGTKPQSGLPFTSEQLMQGIIKAQMAGDIGAQKELGKMLEVVSAYEEMNMKKAESEAKANKPKALTEKQVMYATAADNAKAALKLLDAGKVKTGKGNIIPGAIGKFTGKQDDSQTEFEAYLAGATSAVISALSGANVPESEFKRIVNSIPQKDDEPKIAKQKLKTFIDMASKFTDAEITTMQPAQPSGMDSPVNFNQLQTGY